MLQIDWPKQWFDRNKLDLRRYFFQIIQPRRPSLVFHTHALPNVFPHSNSLAISSNRPDRFVNI